MSYNGRAGLYGRGNDTDDVEMGGMDENALMNSLLQFNNDHPEMITTDCGVPVPNRRQNGPSLHLAEVIDVHGVTYETYLTEDEITRIGGANGSIHVPDYVNTYFNMNDGMEGVEMNDPNIDPALFGFPTTPSQNSQFLGVDNPYLAGSQLPSQQSPGPDDALLQSPVFSYPLAFSSPLRAGPSPVAQLAEQTLKAGRMEKARWDKSLEERMQSSRNNKKAIKFIEEGWYRPSDAELNDAYRKKTGQEILKSAEERRLLCFRLNDEARRLHGQRTEEQILYDSSHTKCFFCVSGKAQHGDKGLCCSGGASCNLCILYGREEFCMRLSRRKRVANPPPTVPQPGEEAIEAPPASVRKAHVDKPRQERMLSARYNRKALDHCERGWYRPYDNELDAAYHKKTGEHLPKSQQDTRLLCIRLNNEARKLHEERTEEQKTYDDKHTRCWFCASGKSLCCSGGESCNLCTLYGRAEYCLRFPMRSRNGDIDLSKPKVDKQQTVEGILDWAVRRTLPRNGYHWTAAEDEKLLRVVENFPVAGRRLKDVYKDICQQHFPNRSQTSVSQRLLKLQYDVGARGGEWTKFEDILLLKERAHYQTAGIPITNDIYKMIHEKHFKGRTVTAVTRRLQLLTDSSSKKRKAEQEEAGALQSVKKQRMQDPNIDPTLETLAMIDPDGSKALYEFGAAGEMMDIDDGDVPPTPVPCNRCVAYGSVASCGPAPCNPCQNGGLSAEQCRSYNKCAVCFGQGIECCSLRPCPRCEIVDPEQCVKSMETVGGGAFADVDEGTWAALDNEILANANRPEGTSVPSWNPNGLPLDPALPFELEDAVFDAENMNPTGRELSCKECFFWGRACTGGYHCDQCKERFVKPHRCRSHRRCYQCEQIGAVCTEKKPCFACVSQGAICTHMRLPPTYAKEFEAGIKSREKRVLKQNFVGNWMEGPTKHKDSIIAKGTLDDSWASYRWLPPSFERGKDTFYPTPWQSSICADRKGTNKFKEKACGNHPTILCMGPYRGLDGLLALHGERSRGICPDCRNVVEEKLPLKDALLYSNHWVFPCSGCAPEILKDKHKTLSAKNIVEYCECEKILGGWQCFHCYKAFLRLMVFKVRDIRLTMKIDKQALIKKKTPGLNAETDHLCFACKKKEPMTQKEALAKFRGLAGCACCDKLVKIREGKHVYSGKKSV